MNDTRKLRAQQLARFLAHEEQVSAEQLDLRATAMLSGRYPNVPPGRIEAIADEATDRLLAQHRVLRKRERDRELATLRSDTRETVLAEEAAGKRFPLGVDNETGKRVRAARPDLCADARDQAPLIEREALASIRAAGLGYMLVHLETASPAFEGVAPSAPKAISPDLGANPMAPKAGTANADAETIAAAVRSNLATRFAHLSEVDDDAFDAERLATSRNPTATPVPRAHALAVAIRGQFPALSEHAARGYAQRIAREPARSAKRDAALVNVGHELGALRSSAHGTSLPTRPETPWVRGDRETVALRAEHRRREDAFEQRREAFAVLIAKAGR